MHTYTCVIVVSTMRVFVCGRQLAFRKSCMMFAAYAACSIGFKDGKASESANEKCGLDNVFTNLTYKGRSPASSVIFRYDFIYDRSLNVSLAVGVRETVVTLTLKLAL